VGVLRLRCFDIIGCLFCIMELSCFDFILA
jgi:hypothetical protein